jgi:hypothetical protein
VSLKASFALGARRRVAAGPWHVGTQAQVSDLNTNEYIFAMPPGWASRHVPGLGRRDRGDERLRRLLVRLA